MVQKRILLRMQSFVASLLVIRVSKCIATGYGCGFKLDKTSIAVYNNIMQKNIVRTYRNGKSVFQMEFIIALKSNIEGTKFFVTERRAQFKDEKPIFVGSEKDAEKFYSGVTNANIVS